MAAQVYIAIVDDKKSVSHALAERLNRFPELEVVFTAGNGKDFLEQMKESRQGAVPDVVLLDIDMPVMDGITAVAEAKLRYPSLQILMLTIFDEDEKIFNAIKAGADGYLLKDEPVEQIREAILNLRKGEGAPMSPSIARRVLKLLGRQSGPVSMQEQKSAEADHNLSEREQYILQLLVDGLEYKEIAQQLGISPHTVRNHITRIYKKLHVSSRAQVQKIMHGTGKK